MVKQAVTFCCVGLKTGKTKKVKDLSTANVKSTNKKTVKRKSKNSIVQNEKKQVG